MRRYAHLAVLIPVLVGCGGNDSALSGSGNGLFSAPARDARDRENLVSTATKELAKGAAARVAESSGPFGFKLIRESAEKGNIVVSPLSVATALSMTLNGAVGETQTQMLDTLGFKKTPAVQVNEASRSIRTLLGNVDPTVQLRVANSIWAREGAPFAEPFLQTNETAYGAKTTRLDFGAPDALETINRWVKEATNGKIEKMVQELSKDDQMVLLNAVYFKGDWRTPFAKDQTKDGVFVDSDGKDRTVPMMKLTSNLGYAEDKGWSAVSLPYGNGRLEMVVMLPSGKLDDLSKSLSSGLPKALDTMNEVSVGLTMPKFKVEFEEKLNKPLQQLGMKLAFGPSADFSAMSSDKLMISTVMHKTFIEVDEQGTEAAASTSVTMTKTSAQIAKPFNVNKPFVFIIR